MDALDLTKRPPRGPREKLDGLCMIPRTIDKLRAELPGGNLGQYRIAGTSMGVLEAIGVNVDDLRAVVASAISEGEIAHWLREHADASVYDKVNEKYLNRGLDTVDAETAASVRGIYPIHARYPHVVKFFDLIELDDKLYFENKANL